MKKLLTFILSHCIVLTLLAQAPQKFSYQCVIRNAGNQLVANQTVGIKISILQGTATGIEAFAETHNPLTNANGLATLEIGGGTLLSGNFSNINWANGPYFIKTETDVNGGSNYTIINTTQLLSVPYALDANDVPSSVSFTGDTLFIGDAFYIIPGISAVNNVGLETGVTAHTCGVDNVHNSNQVYGSMTDQQGNVYKTVTIGNQEWMAENLKTSIYRNGEPISNVTDDTEWDGLTTGAWCYYNNDNLFDCPYGKLYNWYAASDPRNVCPAGWHVPTDNEWSVAIDYLAPDAAGGDNFNIAGGKMKSAGLQYWLNPNQDATNVSGFSGLPGGARYASVAFSVIGEYGNWWSATGFGPNLAWIRFLICTNGDAHRSLSYKRYGFSVRCIRD